MKIKSWFKSLLDGEIHWLVKIPLKLFEYIFILFLGFVGGYLYIKTHTQDGVIQQPPNIIPVSDALASANTYIVYTTFICTIIALLSGSVGVILSNAIYIKKQDILNELTKKLLKEANKKIVKKDGEIHKAIKDNVKNEVAGISRSEEFNEKIEETVRNIAQDVLTSDDMQDLFMLKINFILKGKIKYQSSVNLDPNRQI